MDATPKTICLFFKNFSRFRQVNLRSRMKKLWFTIGFIAFLSGLIVIALVANPAGPREPEYHGKKLTRWLDDLHTLSTSTATQANARLAIQEMGTNAVPFLVQMLHAKDSSFRRRYMALLERQHWVDFHFHSDRQKQSDAVRGLMILGPDAKAAIPTLADLLKYGNLGEGAKRPHLFFLESVRLRSRRSRSR